MIASVSTLLLLLLLLLISSSSSSSSSIASDIAVLSSFKNGVANDPSGALASWNSSAAPLCKWQGVVCSARGRVTALTLISLQLRASLAAAAIQTLPHLRSFTVSGSNFSESFDKISLNSCSLQLLNVSENQLSGRFPGEILRRCPGLKHLDLSRNQISGAFDFGGGGGGGGGGGCTSLEYLDVSFNQMTGAVPEDLVAGCVNLRELRLAYNQLSGSFPLLNSSSNFRSINLAGNSFTSFRIESGAACEKLVEIDIAANNISGKIFPPETDHKLCPRLKLLNISVNSFSGPAAEVLGRQSLDRGFLPNLELLDASYNNLTGEVLQIHENLIFLNCSSNSFTLTPEKFCHPTSKLKSLLLPNNKLVDRLLDSIANCSSLEMLDFSFNAATGHLPESFCERHPQLQHLFAWVNKLDGRIPSTFGDCVNLSTAILSYNNFEGIIPSELAKLQNLWWLSLSSNRLSGSIPPSLGELQTIQVLQLGNNTLEGEVPIELSNCKNLVILDLSANQLTGVVPSRIGRDYVGEIVLGLAPVVSSPLGNCNILEVQFSPCRGRDGLFALQGLRLEVLQQRVSDLATECVWSMLFLPTFNVTLTSLVVLALSYNNLTGGIPRDLSAMQNLYKLDLAHNFLTGPIPDSIAQLKGIQVLDLSQNFLVGHIPDAIGELSFLFNLNVSYNRLSGMIPQKGQLTTFDRSSFEGNPGLFGYPLTNSSAAKPSTAPIEENHPGDDYHDEIVAGIPCFIVSLVGATIVTLMATGTRKVERVLSSRR